MNKPVCMSTLSSNFLGSLVTYCTLECRVSSWSAEGQDSKAEDTTAGTP